MKVLLVGHDGRNNRGCEAIVISTIKMLRKEFGDDVDFVLSSFDVKNDSVFDWGPRVKVVSASDSRLWKKYSLLWFWAKILRRIVKGGEWGLVFAPFKADLLSADIVLSVGGDNYTDDYTGYYDPLRYYLYLNYHVKNFGKKLVIWSASIGPFKRLDRIDFVVDSLKKTDLITVRELKSFDYLFGLGFNNIKRVADVAFTLPIEDTRVNLLKTCPDFAVGFNVSPLIGEYYSNVNKEFVIAESVKFLKDIIARYNAKVLLIPHVVKESLKNNDFHFMSAILKEVNDSSNIELLAQTNNSMQIKSVISQCRFFIGARTHSTIAAFSTGVPTLSIGYSQKSVGINHDLFGHTNYLLDIRDFSGENLAKSFHHVVTEEGKIRSQLATIIPKIKELSLDNARLLRGVLNNERND